MILILLNLLTNKCNQYQLLQNSKEKNNFPTHRNYLKVNKVANKPS